MGTVDTGRASKFRLSERQVGWRLPYPRLRGRPSISGPRFIAAGWLTATASSCPTPPRTGLASAAACRAALAPATNAAQKYYFT
eukprot:scaffold144450_cov130-Phaeocystis_antarctica.AAC.1